MFLESEEGALAVTPPPRRVPSPGMQEAISLHVIGDRCRQLEAETQQIPAENKGQAFRNKLSEQLGELPSVSEGSWVPWEMVWFGHGLSGPRMMPG